MNPILLRWLAPLGVTATSKTWIYWLIAVAAIALVVYIADVICRCAIIPLVRKFTQATRATWDNILINDMLLKDVSRLVPPILIAVLMPLAFSHAHPTLDLLLKVNLIYLIAIIAKLLCTFLSALYDLSSHQDRLKNHPIKGIYQMLKIVVICVALIIVVSILINKNPGYILTALGASAAVLMLVFKDTIMGLVAGVQLSANDMLRPGDWISMPKYGADGAVQEVTLTTVKVQNWDKTISTIPPYALVNDSFQNWRGMWESGGRRVKRSINIDMHTVRFCTSEEMEAFRKEEWMQDFEGTGGEEVNLYVFRHYLEHYLRNHPRVNQGQMIMIRQLQPTAEGLPVELYFFSDGTNWVPYEHLQAEVFDHLLATLHKFGLKVFQSPTGLDLQRLKG